jgi:hypothetical protein
MKEEKKELSAIDLVLKAIDISVKTYEENKILSILNVINRLKEAVFWMNDADMAIEIIEKQAKDAKEKKDNERGNERKVF